MNSSLGTVPPSEPYIEAGRAAAYTQAGMTKKRAAQRKAVDALFNRDSEAFKGEEATGKRVCSLIAPSESLMLPNSAR